MFAQSVTQKKLEQIYKFIGIENICHCGNATFDTCESVTGRDPVLVCFYFRTSRKSKSGDRRRTFPRVFASAPELCHSLMNRLASNNVMPAALASSSLVIASSMPPVTFCPTARPILVSTEAHLWRALSQVRAICAVRYQSK